MRIPVQCPQRLCTTCISRKTSESYENNTLTFCGFFFMEMVTLKCLHCNNMNIHMGTCQSPNLYALKYPLEKDIDF